jgi:hypothetical protein
MSQETASEAFDRTYVANLAAADKNFVLDPTVPWPAIRTKANPMAAPIKKKRRKGVQSNDQNRNRFIVLAFALIFCNSTDKQLVLGDDEQRARLYDDGRYSWIEDTVAVLGALRAHYSNTGSRRQAIMAFRQLCEVLQYIETRDIYGNAMDNPDGEELNPAHEEPHARTPEQVGASTADADPSVELLDSEDSNDADYYEKIKAGLVYNPLTAVESTRAPQTGVSPEQMIMEEVQQMQDKQSLSPITSSLDVRVLDANLRRLTIVEGSPDDTGPTACAEDDAASDASTLVLPSSDDESPDATAEPDRRTQETYQGFLHEYQQYIEQLRLRAMVHLQSETMDVSQWRERKNHAIHAVMAYLCLATAYGDLGGTLEPIRLDWCDAKFVAELPARLADHCMYVLVTADRVSVHLRGGHKNNCAVDQNISDTSPLLAEVLRLWMPHAQSAQPDNNEPYVMIMHVEKKSYGQPFAGRAYGKLLQRTWTGPDSKQLAAPDPHADAVEEENPADRHGYGCNWARKVVSRARRGVIYADHAAAVIHFDAP